MRIEKMLYLYSYICIAMIVFNIIFIFGLKIYPYIVSAYSKYLRMMFNMQLIRYREKKELSFYEAHRLQNSFNRSLKIKAFTEFADNLSDEEFKNMMDIFKHNFYVIHNLCKKKLKQSPLKISFFLKVLYKYNILQARPDDQVLDTIMQYLYMPSIYCRHNAMLLLYQTEDEKRVIDGIRVLNNNDVYTHERVLSVGLLNYTGDKDKLIKLLLKDFYEFKPWIQEAVCNFIPTVSGDYQKEIFGFMNDESLSEEVRVRCLGYLGIHPYKEAYPYFIKYAKNKDGHLFKYSICATKYLYNYPCVETIYALKDAMYTDNWDVRINAANSLEKLGLEYKDLIDIFNGNDRYAMEIMQYFLDVRKIRKEKGEESNLYGRII